VDIRTLPTPQVLIDVDRLRRNIESLQDAARRAGVGLRPHAKTHKIPALALQQIEAGASGICCAKLGEAEVFADAGLEDIRLPYPISPFNRARVAGLMDRARISLIVDHPDVAEAWSTHMASLGRRLQVLVKVDVGYHRCGVDPTDPAALALIEAIDRWPGLELRGLLSHAGHAYGARSQDEIERIVEEEATLLGGLVAAARARGIELPETSVGSTPSAKASLARGGFTELRVGNYVYLDRTQVELGVAQASDCALTVMATVVSRPASDRLVLDCGSKTLSSDTCRGFRPPPGHGAIFGDLERTDALDEDMTIVRLSEEHAVVSTPRESSLKPGDRVRVLPNHACVVSNLVNEVHLVQGSEVVETLPVAARGRLQ